MTLYQRYRYTTTGPIAHENASHDGAAEPHRLPPHLHLADHPARQLRGRPQPQRLGADPTPSAPWAEKQIHQDQLEWLMRWNQVLTTRAAPQGRLRAHLRHLRRSTQRRCARTDGQLTRSTPTAASCSSASIRWRTFRRSTSTSAPSTSSTTSSGDGAYTAWELIPAGGVIWRLGDKLYLYGHVHYDYVHCLSGVATACTHARQVHAVPVLHDESLTGALPWTAEGTEEDESAEVTAKGSA